MQRMQYKNNHFRIKYITIQPPAFIDRSSTIGYMNYAIIIWFGIVISFGMSVHYFMHFDKTTEVIIDLRKLPTHETKINFVKWQNCIG